MVRALIGLGANLGKPAENLDSAKSALAHLESTTLLEASDWISTDPIGGPEDQSEFLNGAALLETSLSPETLVKELQQIERTLGRERIVRWGPRLIDLDIVLYGDHVVDDPDLRIPHPWMALRRFVLEPAVQIAPKMVHPEIGWPIKRLFENLCSNGAIEVTGMQNVDTSSVVEWLAHQTGCVADFERQGESGLVQTPGTRPTLKHLLELTDQWADRRDRWAVRREEVLSGEKTEGEKINVRDHWAEELLVAGKVYLDKSEFKRLHDEWESKFDEAEPRKLLVFITDSSAAAAEDAFTDELWQRVQRRGRGPWLTLDASEPVRMRHDLLAAVTGMQ